MKTWSFTQNPFNNSTKGNYALFYRISLWHLNTLKAKAGDAFFDALIASYGAVHDAYETIHVNWLASEGTHIGGTQMLTDELDKLRGKYIDNWVSRIRTFYAKGSPEYKALFPKGRAPFQHGKHDERVAAVEALSLSLEDYPLLAAIKADVDSICDKLVKERKTQQGELTDTSALSHAVETARLAGATAMYRNLAKLMDHFAENPLRIEPYFALHLIRERRANPSDPS